MYGGLEIKAAEKGVVEMLKMHPEAKRICRNMFEAQDWKMVRQSQSGGYRGVRVYLSRGGREGTVLVSGNETRHRGWAELGSLIMDRGGDGQWAKKTKRVFDF